MKTDLPPQVIPAQPGFWVHTVSIAPENEHPVEPGARYAVLAWMIKFLRPLQAGEDPMPFVLPITSDGIMNEEYFIEQPDGSCIHDDFNTDTVEEAYKNIAEDVIRDNDRDKARAEAASVSQARTIPT